MLLNYELLGRAICAAFVYIIYMKYVVGVDEVGRGSLAGPVVVAGVLIPSNFKNKFDVPLRDSKRLSLSQREGWFDYIKKEKISYFVSRVGPSVIDRINVSGAVNLGALRVVKKFDEDFRLIVDKGIKVKGFNYESYVKADENFPAVALASIVAKVVRDRYMRKIARLYPEYGFSDHVGYGTRRHIEAIRQFGVLDIHRKSFLGNIEV